MSKLYIETYGCQMNVADSEVVASVMRMAGYETCQNIDEADAVFLNTCSVRDNAEQKSFTDWKRFTPYAAKADGSSSAYWAVWQSVSRTICSTNTTPTSWPVPTLTCRCQT